MSARAEMSARVHSAKDGPREVLTDDNWVEWADQMAAFLHIKGVRQWVRQELPDDATDEQKDENELAISYIKMCVSKNKRRQIRSMTSAHKIWKLFEKTHEDTLRPRAVELQQRLFSLRQGHSQSTDDYIEQLQDLNDDLAVLTAPVPEATLVRHIVSTLNSSFDAHRGVLTLNAPSYSLNDLRFALRSLSSQAQPAGQQAPLQPMALAARGLDRQAPTNRGGRQRGGRGRPRRGRPGDSSEEVICDYCGNEGHIATHCILRCEQRAPNQPRDYAPGYPRPRHGMPPSFLSSKCEWVLDSGATDCMTMERHLFREYTDFLVPKTVQFGNGAHEEARGMGTLQLDTIHGRLELHYVLYVPTLASNLLSVSSLISDGYSAHIQPHSTEFVLSNKGKVVATATQREGMYVLNLKGQSKCASASLGESLAMRWHRKLGHTNFGTLADMQRKGMLPNCQLTARDFLSARENEVCTPCMAGKMHRSSHSTSVNKAPHVNFRVHSDVMGPLRTATLTGSRYVVTLMDEYSGFSMIHLITHKSEVLTVLPSLLKQFSTQGGRPVKRIRTDNGGEYVSNQLAAELKNLGIWHETSAAHTPEQNGRAERLNRTIMERARTFLSESGLPSNLWGHAIHHANNIRNSVVYAPTKQVPYFAFTGIIPDLEQFHPFGSMVHVHVPAANRHKLSEKGMAGRYLGVAGLLNSRCHWVLVGKKVCASSDVVFHDDRVPSAPQPNEELLSAQLSAEADTNVETSQDNALQGAPSQPPPPPTLPDISPSRSVDNTRSGMTLLPSDCAESGEQTPTLLEDSRESAVHDQDTSELGESASDSEADSESCSVHVSDNVVSVDNPLFQPDAVEEPQIPQQTTGDRSALRRACRRDVPHKTCLARKQVLKKVTFAPLPPSYKQSKVSTANQCNSSSSPLSPPSPPSPPSPTLTQFPSSSPQLSPLHHTTTPAVNSKSLPPQLPLSQHTSSQSVSAQPVTYASVVKSRPVCVPLSPHNASPAARVHSAKVVGFGPDPVSIEDAKSRPDWPKWEQSMLDEYASHHERGSWTVDKIPPGVRTVGCKLIMERKRSGRYKSRLVVKGFTQRAGIDYEETFAPVSKYSTLRTFLSIAASLDLEIRQVDVKTAFLYGDLEEEIWMEHPPGMPGPPGTACRLNKAVYGLKQANRQWHHKLRTELLAKGFVSSDADPALFLKLGADGQILALVYVDDCLIAGKTLADVQDTINIIKSLFEARDLQEPADFLGIQIVRDRANKTISIHQLPYIQKLLHDYGMTGTAPLSLPCSKIPEGSPLGAEDDRRLKYPSLVGSLMHLANCTRPDISHAMSVLARHLKAPTTSHWMAAVKVLRYLAGTMTLALTYGGPSALVGYTDSDLGGDRTSRRSTTGMVFLLNGAAITWQSKLQPTVALSTTEAEYQAAAVGAREALWLRKLLPELGCELTGPINLLGDNQAALALLHNHMVNDRSKHIDIIHHFARERVMMGEIAYRYTPSQDNIADVLTKPLPKQQLQSTVHRLGLRPLRHLH